jgi:hypothetical protein
MAPMNPIAIATPGTTRKFAQEEMDTPPEGSRRVDARFTCDCGVLNVVHGKLALAEKDCGDVARHSTGNQSEDGVDNDCVLGSSWAHSCVKTGKCNPNQYGPCQGKDVRIVS